MGLVKPGKCCLIHCMYTSRPGMYHVYSKHRLLDSSDFRRMFVMRQIWMLMILMIQELLIDPESKLTFDFPGIHLKFERCTFDVFFLCFCCTCIAIMMPCVKCNAWCTLLLYNRAKGIKCLNCHFDFSFQDSIGVYLDFRGFCSASHNSDVNRVGTMYYIQNSFSTTSKCFSLLSEYRKYLVSDKDRIYFF